MFPAHGAAQVDDEIGHHAQEAVEAVLKAGVRRVHEGVHVQVSVAGMAERHDLHACHARCFPHAFQVTAQVFQRHAAVFDDLKRAAVRRKLRQSGTGGVPQSPNARLLFGGQGRFHVYAP